MPFYGMCLKKGAKAYRKRFVAQTMSVLWESTTQLNGQGWQMSGLTGNYLRVKATAPEPLWNQISLVVMQNGDENGLHGQILNIDP